MTDSWMTIATTAEPSKHLPCTSAESKITRCFNKGQCYAVMINTQRTINCRCPEGFRGKNCSEKYIPHDQSANLFVSVLVVGVVVIVLAIVAFLLWHKCLRKRFYTHSSEQTTSVVVGHHKETSDAENGATQVDGSITPSVTLHTEVAVGPKKVSKGQNSGQRPARPSKDNGQRSARPSKDNGQRSARPSKDNSAPTGRPSLTQ